MIRISKAALATSTVTVAAVMATLLAACGTQATASGPRSSGPDATAVANQASYEKEQRIQLAEEAVRNGTYNLPGVGVFQLKDGNYQEKYGEGATQVNRAGVVTVAFGDVDEDKLEDATVVLWVSTGGSGTFKYLVPMLRKDGKVEQGGAQLLGDRVEIKSLAVEDGKIKVAVLSQGAGDPMVSPSLESVQEYDLRDGLLAKLTSSIPAPQVAPKPTEQPSAQSPAKPTANPAIDGLVDSIWIWQRFVDSNESGSFLIPFPAAYRLELRRDGTFRYQADCNSGAGGYTVEGSRLSLIPGPMTLAECARGSRSTEFVSKLGHVATYVLKGDALYLNLKMDGGDMVFSRLSSVTGRISGPAGESAPTGGTAEVMIVNSAGAQIGGSIVKATLPMQFEAPFKPANIDPSATYILEVTIKDAQKNIVFKNTRRYPVLTQGNPMYNLEIELERVR